MTPCQCAGTGHPGNHLVVVAGGDSPCATDNDSYARRRPYVVHGVGARRRSAAFGQPGWLVLLAAIGALSLSRWRSAV
jgi:hypothetical protein